MAGALGSTSVACRSPDGRRNLRRVPGLTPHRLPRSGAFLRAAKNFACAAERGDQ